MLKIFFWPFTLVWWMVGLAFNILGRVLSLAIGLVLVILGGILTFTVIGAFLGIPLIGLGVLLAVRSLF